ncbi:LOW QUALITY PROTEIN: integrin alpha-7 [Tachyglossus aculeatus]|uniref:LOW QUALITY PROTEIN: integrin alpha-7 n=1 Tax=Tachyglossus aculeatus TaxID=9261 RepID=UPI0018F36D62|nr:LOW QUALITY PROTEIN: integrin alpha-7 [Tachyglossus aculeatus]
MAWVRGSPLLRAFLCALLLPGVGAFNLDVGAALRKDGDPDTLFGFSVALHQQLRPRPQSWLLVGAPRALALPGQAANRTGGLYACPLTSAMEDCYRVDIDQGADVQRESKENQWLGVTVRSQGPGGKIVTCAHLYEARQRVAQPLETRDVIGRCFVLSDDLQVRDELDGGDWRFCEGRPQGHDQFGFCQQGAAAAFSPDRHYLLFGAPGTYNWKGTARAELCDQGPLDLARLDDGPYEAGGEKEQDPRLIPVPANSYLGLLFVTSVDSSDPDQLVYKSLDPAAGDLALNSYLGFSIDAGRGLTRLEELSFVAGAPRANHTGAVVILRRDSASRLVPEAVLAGERLTSGFGYALAVLDLNGDGWTDLVVGAPHFFERQEELGGAVYVYLNRGGRWAGVSPLRLNGSVGSMFGVSVAALGDVNLDGFPDIAVGAPFDGAGKVFIYHGSSLGVVTKPAQVLEGEAVGITTFGYSLSGGLDVDGNDYPDLLVGSLADTVALFRARPVLHVTHNISLSPAAIDLEVPSCADGHGVCVDIRVCFSYVAAPASYSPRVALVFRLDGDTERRKRGQVPRVAFLSRQEEDPRHQATGTVWLQHQQDGDCGDATFLLQENVKDKLRPIVVTMTYGLRPARLRRQVPGQTLPPLTPILNAHQPHSQRAEVHFLKQGCGDDKICQSNLQLVHARFCDRVGDTEFQPLPMDEEDEGTAVFAMSGQADLALEITVTNFPSDPSRPQADGDAAHEAQLLVTFPDTLRYAGVRSAPASAEKPPLCLSNENASRVECELGNPMGRGAQVSFYLVLSTGGITIETTMLEVELLLATISEQELQPVIARARVVIELPLSITGVAIPQQLFFSGEVRGESAMRSERDVGSAVKYEVTVSNRGRSLNTLGSAFVHLRWPHEIANGKWLLYPMRVELEGGGGGGGPSRRGDCGVLTNPLRLEADREEQGRRRRRELGRAELDPQPAPSGSRWLVAAAEKKRNVTLDCALGTASCMDIQCPLSSFDRAAVLRVWGRLWNSTFLEEYPAVKSLELVVQASITVKSTIRNLRLKDASTQIPVTIYLDPAAVVVGGVPWWVILLAVLAGLLVLSLLVLAMWKVGFFKRARRRPEAVVPQYHAVKIPREDRQLFKEEKTGTIQRKDWSTNWGEGTDGHLAPGTA